MARTREADLERCVEQDVAYRKPQALWDWWLGVLVANGGKPDAI